MNRGDSFLRLAESIERALTRAVAVGLGLTVAVQALLISPSLRPVLNYAHRAEGTILGSDLRGGIVSAGMVAGGRPAGTGTVTLAIDEGRGGRWVWIEAGGRYAGRLTSDGDPRAVEVEVADGEEILLKTGGAGADPIVTVVAVSENVRKPAGGLSYTLRERVYRIKASVRNP